MASSYEKSRQLSSYIDTTRCQSPKGINQGNRITEPSVSILDELRSTDLSEFEILKSEIIAKPYKREGMLKSIINKHMKLSGYFIGFSKEVIHGDYDTRLEQLGRGIKRYTIAMDNLTKRYQCFFYALPKINKEVLTPLIIKEYGIKKVFAEIKGDYFDEILHEFIRCGAMLDKLFKSQLQNLDRYKKIKQLLVEQGVELCNLSRFKQDIDEKKGSSLYDHKLQSQLLMSATIKNGADRLLEHVKYWRINLMKNSQCLDFFVGYSIMDQLSNSDKECGVIDDAP